MGTRHPRIGLGLLVLSLAGFCAQIPLAAFHITHRVGYIVLGLTVMLVVAACFLLYPSIREHWPLRWVGFGPQAVLAASPGYPDSVSLTFQERQIVEMRIAGERAWAADPNAVSGPLAVYPGAGSYGSLSMADARRAFEGLERKGLIRYVRQAGMRTEFEWTDAGRRLAEEIAKK